MSVTLPDKVTGADSAMEQYLREIRAIPLLTAQQERTLAVDCARGDENAIRTMVSANLRLVVSVAREYAGRGVPMLDLIQEGSIGLLEAAKRFDPQLEYRFSTYAAKWIRSSIRRCCLTHGDLVHVPLHTAEKMRKLLAVKNALQQELGREATLSEIAQRSGIPEDKVKQLLERLPEICSLDAPVGEEEDALQQLLRDAHAPQPQEDLVRQEMKRTMDKLLDMLTPRQRQVLRLRFGMEDGVCYTVEQIGVVLGVSKERARQIEHQARQKLQTLGADFGLEDFLE